MGYTSAVIKGVSWMTILRASTRVLAFVNPSVVKFQKELYFNKEFWYRFTIFFVDTVISIVLTFSLRSPVGIVIGFLSGVLLELILSFFIVKPTPSLIFHKEYFLNI